MTRPLSIFNSFGMPQRIGDTFRFYRIHHLELTLEDAARQLEITPDELDMIEQGKGRDFTLEFITKAKCVFGCDLADFVLPTTNDSP